MYSYVGRRAGMCQYAARFLLYNIVRITSKVPQCSDESQETRCPMTRQTEA